MRRPWKRSTQRGLFPKHLSATELAAFDEKFRKRGYFILAGVDEAGRGPLAGPVVAAAVILPPRCGLEGIRDSKALSPKSREDLFEEIKGNAVSMGVGVIEADEIDRTDILRATTRAMERAVSKLDPTPDALLIDGPRGIGLTVVQFPVVKGDTLSQSIAAASIVAKVIRDRMMATYHALYPQYGFDRHKGYATRAHLEAIQRHGYSPIHRRTFRGVRGVPEARGITNPSTEAGHDP